MSGIFEALLAEQQKTNAFLAQLVANGVKLPNADAGETKGKSAAESTETEEKAPSKTTKKKEADKPAKPKHTKDEVVAAVVAVKDKFGAPEAKKITAHFELKKVAEAKEDQFDAIVAMCNERLAEAVEEEDEDEI